jgi:hypothetical protein
MTRNCTLAEITYGGGLRLTHYRSRPQPTRKTSPWHNDTPSPFHAGDETPAARHHRIRLRRREWSVLRDRGCSGGLVGGATVLSSLSPSVLPCLSGRQRAARPAVAVPKYRLSVFPYDLS